MLCSKTAGRFFAAVALAAVFFAAVPAWAAEGREEPRGMFERLIEWIVGINMAGSTGTSREHDGGHVDPNGRTGACTAPAGCDAPLPVPGAYQGGW